MRKVARDRRWSLHLLPPEVLPTHVGDFQPPPGAPGNRMSGPGMAPLALVSGRR